MPAGDYARPRGRSGTIDRSNATANSAVESLAAPPASLIESKRKSDEEGVGENRPDSRLFHRIRPELLFSDFAPMVMVSPALWEYAGTGDGDERKPQPILWLFRVAARPFVWIGARVLRWMTRDRERRHLHGLNDRMLKDIGLSRADIERRVGRHHRHL